MKLAKIFTIQCLMCMCLSALAQNRYSETLNRAPVAVKSSQGILVSWRSLTRDADGITFNVLRNGKVVARGINNKTNFLDTEGGAGDTYRVETVLDGTVIEASSAMAWSNIYTSISVPRPAAHKSGNTVGRYRPDDMSVGDVDGDGDYELILKWMPDNQRDNGTPKGYSSPCILDCYEMDGTQLWRIDLGENIRSGNHYTQFLVYDFDGDGKAEMVCKTAPGSKDGKGHYVTAAATDSKIKNVDNTKICYATSGSYTGNITSGEEFLTVFNGQTGAAMHTIWYSPSRAMVDFPSAPGTYSSGWGDTNQNRGNRFNACVAYLDGLDHAPSAILERGYYKACYVWAVDWNGTALSTRWLHKSLSADSWSVVDGTGKVRSSGTGKSCFGQGVHSISVGDVNNDSYDEIITGSATLAHDGACLSSTGYGHGDAIHVAPLSATSDDLLVMMPHEESPYGYDVHNPSTGNVVTSATGSTDNGRGLAADFIPSNDGFEFWSSHDGNMRSCTNGSTVMAKRPDTNFRIYWTGDPYDQTFDGHYNSATGKCAPCICAYNTSSKSVVYVQQFADYGSPATCNGTKATPCLQADILGDWREELIMYEYEGDYSAGTCKLLIYSTPEETRYKVPCLMEDHVYRMGIAWQNSSYNQPPHLGYKLDKFVGVNGKTYTTHTQSHAPEPSSADTPAAGIESLTQPAADKGTVKGICYSAGAGGELTSTASNGFLKLRTGNNDRMVFSVNEGYIITGVTITAYSNNPSTVADRSICLTGVYADNSTSSVLPTVVKFPGGTAGQSPVTAKVADMEARQQVTLTFDNSRIVDAATDASGKNKQIMATVTFTYRKVDTTGIQPLVYGPTSSSCCHDLAGRLVNHPSRGMYVKNGRKVIIK